MTGDPKIEGALALHRFGCGPRAGSIAAIASDPRGALIAEIDRPGAGQINDPELLDQRAGRARGVRVQFRAARRAASPKEEEGCRARAHGCRRHGAAARAEARDGRESGANREGGPASAAHLPPGGQGACRRGARRRDRLRRAAGVVLVEPLLHFRRQGAGGGPAATNARRSGRTCSAASPTCCSRSKAIRRC